MKCENPDCFDFATGGRAELTAKQIKAKYRFCSNACFHYCRRGGNGTNRVRIRRDGERIYRYQDVMEQKLGRPLEPGEVVHHLDHNEFNDDEDNLKLFESLSAHMFYHWRHPDPEFFDKTEALHQNPSEKLICTNSA